MYRQPRPAPVLGGRPAVPLAGGGARVPADPQVQAPGDPTQDELVTRIAGLEQKMASLPEIEQAKGALMLTYGLTADAAFQLLRFHSMNRNVKIRSLAATIAGLLPHVPTTTAATARFDRILAQAADALHSSVPTAASSGAGSEERTPLLSTRPGRAERTPSALDHDAAAAGPGVTIAENTRVRPFIYANDAFTTLTGYPRSMILGRNCRFLQGPDTDPRDIAKLGRALRAGTDISVVLRNYRKDGSPFWNEVSISPLLGPTGQITHWVGTQIEVTHA